MIAEKRKLFFSFLFFLGNLMQQQSSDVTL